MTVSSTPCILARTTAAASVSRAPPKPPSCAHAQPSHGVAALELRASAGPWLAAARSASSLGRRRLSSTSLAPTPPSPSPRVVSYRSLPTPLGAAAVARQELVSSSIPSPDLHWALHRRRAPNRYAHPSAAGGVASRLLLPVFSVTTAMHSLSRFFSRRSFFFVMD